MTRPLAEPSNRKPMWAHRRCVAVVALMLLAGCRAPAPPSDPFLNRTTIPPPGTMNAPLAGAPGQPYYAAPATAPPLINPGTPAAPATVLPAPAAGPAVMPMPAATPAPATMPGALPAIPAAPADRLAPPGGFQFQSSNPAPSPSTTAATSPSGAVTPAGGWQTPTPVASGSGDSVRIIEPPAATTASTSAAAPANPAAASPTASSGSVAPQPLPSDQTSAPMPAAISDQALLAPALPAPATTTAAVAPAAQSPPNQPILDITDLPAHAGPASIGTNPASAATPQSAAISQTAQKPTTDMLIGGSSAPGDRPGAVYSNDPDYRTLRGKLEYSVNTRRWRLRYMPVDGPVDEYGGSVILSDGSQLESFEPGDFVTAQGTLSAPTSGAGGLAPLYTLQSIARQ